VVVDCCGSDSPDYYMAVWGNTIQAQTFRCFAEGDAVEIPCISRVAARGNEWRGMTSSATKGTIVEKGRHGP
jgi:hypothetical protein